MTNRWPAFSTVALSNRKPFPVRAMRGHVPGSARQHLSPRAGVSCDPH